MKSQDDRPVPEIPHKSRANLRVPARVCDVEGGAVCYENSAIGYFNGTKWTPRLRSPPLIMAPGGCLWDAIAHDNGSTGGLFREEV